MQVTAGKVPTIHKVTVEKWNIPQASTPTYERMKIKILILSFCFTAFVRQFNNSHAVIAFQIHITGNRKLFKIFCRKFKFFLNLSAEWCI